MKRKNSLGQIYEGNNNPGYAQVNYQDAVELLEEIASETG